MSDGEWTEAFFGGLWLDLQRQLHPEEQSQEEAEDLADLLELEPGDRVLDAPCGEGRISRALAELELDCIGIDQSEALLADARARAEAAGVQVRYERCDMRHADRVIDIAGGDEPLDAVLNIWGSFGYFGDGGVFGDGGGDLAFARAAATVLRPGGQLLIDCPAIETVMHRYQGRGWAEAGAIRALESRAWDPIEGVMHVEWTLVRELADGRAEMELRHTHMRLYSVPELCRLLGRAGFRGFEVYSTLDGAPWKPGDRMVLVATR